MKVYLRVQEDGLRTVTVLGDDRHHRRQETIRDVARKDVSGAILDMVRVVKEKAGLDPESPGPK
jgi:hypothetical protein